MDGKEINMMDDHEPEFTNKSNTEQPPKKQSEKHARFSVANVINPSSKGNTAETIRFSNEKQDDEVSLIVFHIRYVTSLNMKSYKDYLLSRVYLFCIIVVSNSIS